MKGKKLIITGVLAVAVLAGVYLAGRFYYTGHFYPNTKINGADCGNRSADDVLASMEETLADYKLTIHDAVTDMEVTADNVGLQYKDESVVTQALEKQNPDLWFTELAKDHGDTSVEMILDEDSMKSYLGTLECMNPETVQKPVSAKLVYNEDNKCFEIQDEIIGNVIRKKVFYQAVEDAIFAGEEELDLTTNEYYKQPNYFASDEDVLKAKETVDLYMSSVIQYKHGSFEYTLDAEEIHNLLKISKKFKVSFDEDAIADFVEEELFPVFNTKGSTRTITTPGSGSVTISGGDYGWRVSIDQETEQIEKDLATGTTVEREPLYLQEAKSREAGNDIGDTYVDVNISKQTLYVVEDGSIVFSSAFVSGNVNEGHETHKGVYQIAFKRTNYAMPKYHVTVQYWMPFNTYEGEGFHDATWRNTFGGSYYITTGSHGCINMPLSSAKWMYYNVPCFTPVIVH